MLMSHLGSLLRSLDRRASRRSSLALALGGLVLTTEAEAKKKGRKKKGKKGKSPPTQSGCTLFRCAPHSVEFLACRADVAAKLDEQFLCRAGDFDTRTNRAALQSEDLKAKRQVSCYVSHHLSGCEGNCCATSDTELEKYDSATCNTGWGCGGAPGAGADG
jgi:hypothetical protein